jgi:hypothetical protein
MSDSPSLSARSDDLAALIALDVSLGGTPSPKEERLLRTADYFDEQGLTDAGWTAAGDALGFQEYT